VTSYYRQPARIRIRKRRAAGVLAVIAAISAALGYQASQSPTAASPAHVLRSVHRGLLGEPDSTVPDGTTVFDDRVAGVAKLDPALLGALRRAASDAGQVGVVFYVDSGWRSPAYQERLFQEAVSKYGSAAEAARWVAPPDRSAHVSGDAIDLAHDAAGWLSEHGAAYGLCRIYANEAWHFELRPEAVTNGCPAMYADPSQDPRMQR
jgi:zinc D-Ala-D-Ala carboxypeptidase